ncbi:hypothetical protein M9H77_04001 [Catharanthus roseus]|uniref:Uncharacterized protein n=1 Tax=Catharanthus roseus TaxID=4058 RepID=A0ACC0CD91_CATRO|nr:hypothetical protein M9H77_04001 [Catharanthus roseus]
MGRRGREVGKHTGGSISFIECQLNMQADSTERFSKSRHLEELSKYQIEDNKGQYVDFHFRETKFHESRQKAEAEVAVTGTPMPDDLQLTSTIFGKLSCGRRGSQAADGLPPYYLEAEQRIMRWVEGVVSSVCNTLDEHMRQFVEQSYLSSTPMPPMMDIVRAAMVVVPSTSSSMTASVVTSGVRLSSSTPPPPSIDALGH